MIDEQKSKEQGLYTPGNSEMKSDEMLTAGDNHGQGGLVTGGQAVVDQRAMYRKGTE